MVSNTLENNLSGFVVPGSTIEDIFGVEYILVDNFIHCRTHRTVTLVYNKFDDKFELKNLEWFKNTTIKN